MTNFDFLLTDNKFNTFAETAVNAEKAFNIEYALCALSCRRALEFAVKWLYSVDGDLVKPYQDNLKSLVCDHTFKDVIDANLNPQIEYIIKLGNNAAHKPKSVSKEQAILSLKNLHAFMDFVAYCYGDNYEGVPFNKELVGTEEVSVTPKADNDIDLEKLIKENASLKLELTAQRQEREKTFTAEQMDYTEAGTRKALIDVSLVDIGWERGKNWMDEYPIGEMPNSGNKGFADYVLFGDDGKPLAVIEAKKTSVAIEKGRQQAVLYADFLEKEFGRRPIIFLTNGYETRIWSDKYYPERPVSCVYSKRDLEKEFNKMSMRTKLDNIKIDDVISNRYYQKEAIKAVCNTVDKANRRKALLVMATGSGKTRTVISIVDVLTRHGWVKNVLFLADRTSLVIQAKRSFNSLLPNLSLCNLTESKDDPNARAVFSTYQTMINCIDNTKGNDGKKLFTSGHFDLIICDEAHRSIYNKYKDIFSYFDSILIGLTATPKDEIDFNTYNIFELESGVPTYGYELDRAVEDGYLVNFESIETKIKFIDEGITYADLSEEEKIQYEETFADEDGNFPDSIEGTALNDWLFNHDTIKQVLSMLMENGLKVDYDTKLGKTIIFAKSHKHAEEILKVFNREYPQYPNFAQVIDNQINYSQSLIDNFSDNRKMPQIAISVDMLDTGIDVPEILNLVFFKRIRSKAKFWQMIGRGTRLCEGLIDGNDKDKYYIFDFCGNFEFFRINKKGVEATGTVSLQERIFNLKADISFKLQDLEYQTDYLIGFRKSLVEELSSKTATLNRENFAVKQHLRWVDKFSCKDNYNALRYEDTLIIAEHVAPLISPEVDEISAVRFDALMYQIELAYLIGKTYKKARKDLANKINALCKVLTLPEVKAKSDFLRHLLNTDYIDTAEVNEFEKIRQELRDLMKFIKYDPKAIYFTNFKDDILSTEWHESDLKNDDLKDYKKKVNYYIRQHQDEAAIAKLKGNIPLTTYDVSELERILWSEVGSKQDYEKEFGNMPLGELVRSIVGLDMQAANDAFSEFLNGANLDQAQSYFVKQIINYIVKNGLLKDMRVLQESPFTDMGNVSEVFVDISVFTGIKEIIQKINSNAMAA